MALGVSKVWGSAGTGAWRVWGSGGLLERKCEEKWRTKSAKEKLWEHCEELLRSILEEKSEKGEHRPHKSVQEILRGFEYDQKYRCFLGFGCLGGRQERFREHLGSFLETCWEAFLVRSSAESRNVEHRSRSSRLEREAL